MNKLLRFPEIKKLTGLSRSTIFRLERKGQFPHRKLISSKAVAWSSDQVEAWLQSRQVVAIDVSNHQHSSAK